MAFVRRRRSEDDERTCEKTNKLTDQCFQRLRNVLSGKVSRNTPTKAMINVVFIICKARVMLLKVFDSAGKFPKRFFDVKIQYSASVTVHEFQRNIFRTGY